MAHLSSSIQGLQSFFSLIDDDLAYVHSRLQSEYARLYPHHSSLSSSSTHVNPMVVITQLRDLQKKFVETRDQLLDVHQKKMELAHLIREDLTELHDMAAKIAPWTGEMTELEKAKRKTDKTVEQFIRGHEKVAGWVDVKQVDMAMLNVGIVGGGRKVLSEVQMKEDKVEKEERKDEHNEEKSKNINPEPKSSKASKPKVVEEEDNKDKFVGVEKSVYNRLPRNLKIKAGKFADINAFYEKVWTLMSEHGGEMKEGALKKALGESDASRLDVLRGLTVLRRAKNGWMLVPQKTQKTTVKR